MLRLSTVLLLALLPTSFFGLQAASICVVAKNAISDPVTNVTIAVVDNTSGERRTSSRSETNGKTCVPSVPEGEYAVEASAPGFMRIRVYPIIVRTPDEITLPIQLILGSFDPELSTYVGFDATAYGTLIDQGSPAPNAKLCLFEGSQREPAKCVNTNDVGQYKLVIRPGRYRVELTPSTGKSRSAAVAFTSPGFYHNRILFPAQ